MKRIATALFAVLLLFAATGCGANNGQAANPFKDIALDTLLTDIYAGVGADLPALETQPITAETEQYYLGATGLDIKEAIASEPMISAIAYSVCLVRLNEGADVAAAKKAIAENIDPAKWICVRVDKQNVIVDSAGDVIILIMSDDFATAIHDSFTALAAK